MDNLIELGLGIGHDRIGVEDVIFYIPLLPSSLETFRVPEKICEAENP